MQSTKPTVDPREDVELHVDRLDQLASNLEDALEHTERLRNRISKLRAEADAIAKQFEALNHDK
jgi:hypothetical protein